MGTIQAHRINLARNFDDGTGRVADSQFSSPLVVSANFIYRNQCKHKVEDHHIIWYSHPMEN